MKKFRLLGIRELVFPLRLSLSIGLTVIILSLSVSQSYASEGFPQDNKFTISVKQSPISEVLDQIEKQSDYSFLYNRDVVDVKRKIDLAVKETPINALLSLIFDGTTVNYKIVDQHIILSPRFQNVNKKSSVSGVVSDANGVPLPGVTIQVKGASRGVVTGIDGDFIIKDLSSTDVLIFSFIGMKTIEVVVAQQSTLAIVLNDDSIGLNEVVAIGYGVVRKSDITGAISKVTDKEISSSPVSRVDQALQGKTAGVQVTSTNGAPGEGTTIRIRGGNSINASNEPLFVIDGFIGGGDLNSINPSDIASMEILKDASATAIYGARGANGVILITTKKGTAGKSKISFDVYHGIQQLPRKIDLLRGPDRAIYANEADAVLNAPISFPDLSVVTHTDWQDEITQTAPMSNYNLAISGGNEKLTYFFSANYFNQEGIIRNSGFERFQTRLNLNAKLNSWLSFGANMNLNRSDRANNTVNLYNVLKEAATVLPVYDEDGDYNKVNPLSGQFFENPLAQAVMMKNNTYRTRFLGNWNAIASFNNGLTIKSTFGADLNFAKQNIYNPGELPVRKEQNRGGYGSVSTAESVNILNENTINYIKTFGKHRINILGGATIQKSQSENLWASGDGFTNDLLEYNKLSTGDPEKRKSDTGFKDWTILSFLGRVNYSLSDKYLFTLSARQDGSSRLAKKNKWAFFPSAAVAWRLGEEDFVKNLNVFHNLKIRASYGKTGSQAIDIYSTLPTLGVTKYYFNQLENIGYRQGNLANEDLKWETTDQLSFGLDASFLDGKLSLETDLYYKKTKDLLLSVELPGTTGYSSRLDNIGEVENKGIEVMLHAIVFDNKEFSWDASFNIATNRNKVLDLGTDKGYRDVGTGARLIEGEPAAVFYGAVYDGTWKSQAEIDANPGYMVGAKPGFPRFKDVNGNNKFDGLDDYAIIGSPEADFFGGIRNNFHYKNFDLDIFFNFSYGNDIFNTMSPRFFFGDYASNVHSDLKNRWTEQNSTSNIPGAGSISVVDVNTTGYSISVHDGSFLRLKTVKLSYALPANKLPWVSKASIYFTGENLWLLSNYDYGYDPEVNSQGTNSVLRGFDGSSYPQNRTFILGVNVEF